MRKLIFGFGLIGACAIVAAQLAPVLSQTTQIPQVQRVMPNDLIPVIPLGRPSAGSQFATPAQITSQSGYYKSVPITAFTLTLSNTQTNIALNPAGTLAWGYVTLAPTPSDGSRVCIFSTQTITNLSISPNAGQSINNAVTTLLANTSACYLYGNVNSTWDRD